MRPVEPQKRVFETVLYASDLGAAVAFYADVLGFEMIQRSDVLAAFRCGDGVLLIFDRKKSAASGRGVPSHGTAGTGHVAFAASATELAIWRERLRGKGVAIESEVAWEVGGNSIYFRDPDGNILEFAPPTLWGGGWF